MAIFKGAGVAIVTPIHYIVFATPHKKKYLLQKRQLIPLSFLLSKNPAASGEKIVFCCVFLLLTKLWTSLSGAGK